MANLLEKCADSFLLPTPFMPTDPSAHLARVLALQERTFEFACAVITAYPPRDVLDEPSRIIWRELVKSAGSSTFNLEEADAASRDADFVAKMRIALREAKEARVVNKKASMQARR